MPTILLLRPAQASFGSADYDVLSARGREQTAAVVEDRRLDEYDSDDQLSHHSSSAVRQDRPPGAGVPEVSSRAFQDVLEAALESWIAAGASGPSREPFNAFAARTVGACQELAAGLGSGETAVACTSGGVISAGPPACWVCPPEPSSRSTG